MIVATIQLGRSGGLNASRNWSIIPPHDLTEADGVLIEDDELQKEPGGALVGTLPTGHNAVAGFDWWPTDSNQHVVTVTSGGSWFKESGGSLSGVTLATGVTVSPTPVLVSGGEEIAGMARKLFLANGIDPVRVVAGTNNTASNLAIPPADWTGANQPSVLLVHGSRLWGAGNANSPHRIYASGPQNHEDFTCVGSAQFLIYPGVGRRIASAVSAAERLWIFKYPLGIVALDTSSPRLQDWTAQLLTGNLGVANSPYAALAIGSDVLFLSAEGTFHLLSRVTPSGDPRESDLSAALNVDTWLRENLNLGRLHQAQSVWYAHRQTAIWVLPRPGSTSNDLVLRFDFSNPQRPRFTYSLWRPAALAVWLRQDPSTGVRTLAWSDVERVLTETQTRSLAGAAYTGRFSTPEMDFGFVDPALASRTKNFHAVEVVQRPQASGTMSLEVWIDGTLRQTIPIDLAKPRVKRLIFGRGERLRLVGVHNAVGNFELHQIRVHFQPGAPFRSPA